MIAHKREHWVNYKQITLIIVTLSELIVAYSKKTAIYKS